FAIRDDFVPELENYSRELPGRLRSRFRLDRLPRNAAISIVRNFSLDLATGGDREEKKETSADDRASKHQTPQIVMEHDAACETRVDYLLTARDGRDVGGNIDGGPSVDPLWLHLACSDLWDRAQEEKEKRTGSALGKEGKLIIGSEDVQEFIAGYF